MPPQDIPALRERLDGSNFNAITAGTAVLAQLAPHSPDALNAASDLAETDASARAAVPHGDTTIQRLPNGRYLVHDPTTGEEIGQAPNRKAAARMAQRATEHSNPSADSGDGAATDAEMQSNEKHDFSQQKDTKPAGDLALEEAQQEFDALIELQRDLPKIDNNSINDQEINDQIIADHGRKRFHEIQEEVIKLRDKHIPHKQPFDTIINDVAFGNDAQAVLADIKGLTRSTEKVASRDGDISELKDVLRASLIVRSIAEVQPMVETLKGRFPSIVQIKDRFAKPTPAGYKDILITVELSPGIHAEIQIHIPEMIQAKEAAHPLYEQLRSLPKDKASRAKAKELTSKMKEIYAAADRLAASRQQQSKSKPRK